MIKSKVFVSVHREFVPSGSGLSRHFPTQPSPRQAELMPNGVRGAVGHQRDLLGRHATEVVHLDDLSQSWISAVNASSA
jgi:hypothetical protein